MSELTLTNRRFALGVGIFTDCLKYFAWWIVAGVIAAIAIPLIVGQWADVNMSGWYHAGNVAKIWTAILAGGFLYSLMPTLVAVGVTRREIAGAMGVFGLLWVLAFALLTLAGFLAEHTYYDLLGWSQGIDQETPMPLETYGEVFAFILPYPLTYAVYFTGGALIGAGAYHSDAGWFMFIPVIPVGLALDDLLSKVDPWGPGWLVHFVTGRAEFSPWVAAAVAVAVLAFGVWATRRLIVNSPIRGKAA
ncbi:hypothetical protein AB0B28_19335 [Glycomyces sp. NPDC046736]|uniref:hypothetical protein n=1 Tax=Glycomyces sp. NPDC046736 TaxID=3155615 RepID=UPI00340C143C